MTVSGPLYWETRAMCTAVELGETTEPRMRAYLLTVAANARLEVLAWRRVMVARREEQNG
jgi:hypothetical protein